MKPGFIQLHIMSVIWLKDSISYFMLHSYSTQCFRELEQSQWLFPFKDLQFKGGLGSGAFGIVRKAEVLSTQPGKPPLTVAVKSVKGKHVR